MVALHFCDVTLSAKKPISEAYPKTLKTVGDHLRKRRLDLKLYQKDVAKAIGVDSLTICNWEKNRTSPRLYLMPKVFEFLGYYAFESNDLSLGDQIKAYRIREGLSLRRMAKILGADPDTVARWENEGRIPNRVLLKKLKSLGVIRAT